MTNILNINTLSYHWWYCTKCKRSFVIPIEDENKHLLKKGMRCPNFTECSGKVSEKAWSSLKTPRLENFRCLSALDFYQASAGVGLPEERKCSPDAMKKMLLGARIHSAHIEKSPDPSKSMLLSLTLDNGKTLHLATSVKGPLIYKVTEKS